MAQERGRNLIESIRTSVRRIAWGITGSAHQLIETYNVLSDIKKRTSVKFTVFLSKEGERVAKWYQLWERIQSDFPDFKVEEGPNDPFIAGPLQMGYYDLLIIAPATANTVAKVVCGIADTLVTNAVSQTAKGTTPIYILPADRKAGRIKAVAPSGKTFEISMRAVDVNNTARLGKMENITLLEHPDEIYNLVGLAPPAGGAHS